MTDYVTIANLAATHIGASSSIVSADDDSTVARAIKAVWDPQRRAAIRDHTWNFAMRRTGLAAEALDDIPYPWAASFPLPADCLRLVENLSLSTRSDYQVEGKAILCNTAGPLYIRYLVDVVEPALWDDLFVEAFARRIAFQIGPRIAGSDFDKEAAWRLYKATLSEAKRVDARENPQIPYEPTDWELARTGYGATSSDWGGYPKPGPYIAP